MLIPQKHYAWECDYGDREPVFQALSVLLASAGAYEMPMVALFVNNSPYRFEFYVIFGFETATESQIELMHRSMTALGAKLRSDITLDAMIAEMANKRFNSCTVIDDMTLGFAKKTLFLTPERKDFARVWPVTPMTKGVHVFLSHSSKDKPYVEAFMAYMIGEGVKVWYDRVDIDYGDNITEKIQSGIGESGGVLFFVTESFLSSNWCKREMNAFLRKNIDDPKIWIGIVRASSVAHALIPEFLKDLKYCTTDLSVDPKQSAVELAASVKRRFQNN